MVNRPADPAARYQVESYIPPQQRPLTMRKNRACASAYMVWRFESGHWRKINVFSPRRDLAPEIA